LKQAIEDWQFSAAILFLPAFGFSTVTRPPRRDRVEDIHPLIFHFSRTGQRDGPDVNVTGISREALRALIDYAWPAQMSASLKMPSNARF
jgi:DNA-binding NtrC family response regulator